MTQRTLNPIALLAAMLSLSTLAIVGLLPRPAMAVTPAAAPTESQVIASLAATGVRPALTTLEETGSELSAAAQSLCAQPSVTTLERARAAWRAAYLAWRRAEPFQFGALKTLDLGKRIGYGPANIQVLEGALASPDLSDLLRAPDTRGYAAAEFLLFAPKDAPAATRDQRCAHLIDVTGEITALTTLAVQAWEQDYGPGFLAAGDGAPFLLPGDALSLPVAEALNVTERMLRDRIGPPSGFFEEPASPERLEAWHSGLSRDALLASLDGLRLMLLGNGETGIAALVATHDGVLSRRDPELAAELDRRLEKAIAALGEDKRPLYEELRDKPRRLKRLYREVERLQQDIEAVTLVLELDVLPTNPTPMF